MCSYPKSGKKGHTTAQCWLRKKEQEKVKLKQAGRSRNFKRSPRESAKKVQLRPPARGRGACYVLAPGSIMLLNVLTGQTQMTEKRRKAAQKELHLKQVSPLRNKTDINWNRYTRLEERDTEDEDSDEAHILMSNSYNNDDEVSMAEDLDRTLS